MTTTDDLFFDSTDTQALNAAASAVMQAAEEQDHQPVDVDRRSEELPDTEVRLPGGYVDFGGESFGVLYDVEVRELNGADEEALAKIPGVGRALQVILERGTVSIEGQKMTKDILDALLMGDRDAILLGIRMATYGTTVEFDLTCPACGEQQEAEFDLREIPVRTLSDPSEKSFTMTLRDGRSVSVELPDGKTHRELLMAENRSVPEMNTLMLAGCLKEIDGRPVSGLKTAQGLGIRDREALTAEIAKKNPGPLWAEAKEHCTGCQEEIPLVLSLVALFRM